MKPAKGLYSAVLRCAFVLSLLPLSANSGQSSSASQAASTVRDGSHDFDPLLGYWKYHLRRPLNPLTGSNTWVDFNGTGVCRKVDNGAQIDESHGEGSA